MTKDERLLIEIYRQMVSKKREFVNPFEIGKSLGYKEHLVKNIVRGLMQANLVKRFEEDEVGLTNLGKEIAQKIMK